MQFENYNNIHATESEKIKVLHATIFRNKSHFLHILPPNSFIESFVKSLELAHAQAGQ